MKCFDFSLGQKKSLTPSSKAKTNQILEGPVQKSLGDVQIFSFMELKDATQGFRSSNKIGAGGFGSVYKGRFRDGSFVAVKVLSAESKQGDGDFISEIRAMSKIRHANVVKLLGGCVERKNRILVYEYMENNSLAKVLLGGEHKMIKLGWKRRQEICLGVAKGISYLHEKAKPHIVHRDIKASNILLDASFTPKVSDFGLSKLFPDNITHISTRVAGTLGYLAPEYGIRGHLTRKSDVYSFGVLVLEILTGRSAVDFDMELGEYFLVDKAWEMYKDGDLLKLMDSTLKGEFTETEALLFLRVGLLCVQETPGLRPKMSEAIKMMSDKMDMKDIEITQPTIITDLIKLKVASGKGTRSSVSKFPINVNHTQSPYIKIFQK